jgi:hypothetical protein
MPVIGNVMRVQVVRDHAARRRVVIDDEYVGPRMVGGLRSSIRDRGHRQIPIAAQYNQRTWGIVIPLKLVATRLIHVDSCALHQRI